MAQAYRLVVADASMVGVIFVGALFSAAVFAAIAVPVWLWTRTSLVLDLTHPSTLLLFAVAGWASTFVSLVFSGAVVAAGVARLDGHPISTRQALAVAASRWRQLAAWSAVTQVVALFEGLLRRFGLAGLIARIVADVAWAVATMLALPIIVVEGKMPFDAIRESATLVKSRLGLTVRSKVRFYLPWMIVSFLAAMLVISGVVVFLVYRHDTPSWAAAGLILAGVGALALFSAGSVQNAANAYLNLLLYRHALGQPVVGVDTRDLPTLLSPPAAPPTLS